MIFSKFLIAGTLNTLLTYFIYLGLLLLMPYIWAYSLTYAIGIVLGYFLNTKWVFKKAANLRTATVYPLSYGFNYLFGVVTLWYLIETIKLPKEIAPLVVVTISVPIMYLFTKAIFQGKLSHETKKNNQ